MSGLFSPAFYACMGIDPFAGYNNSTSTSTTATSLSGGSVMSSSATQQIPINPTGTSTTSHPNQSVNPNANLQNQSVNPNANLQNQSVNPNANLQTQGVNTSQSAGASVNQNPGANFNQNPGANMNPNQGLNMNQNQGANINQNPSANINQNPGANINQNPGANQNFQNQNAFLNQSVHYPNSNTGATWPNTWTPGGRNNGFVDPNQVYVNYTDPNAMIQQQAAFQNLMNDQNRQNEMRREEELKRHEQKSEEQRKFFELQQQQQQIQFQKQMDAQREQMQTLHKMQMQQMQAQIQNQNQQIQNLSVQQSSKDKKKKNVVVAHDDDESDDENDENDDEEFRKLSSFNRNHSIADTGMTEKEFRHIFAHLSALNPEGCLVEDHSILSVAEVAKENIAAKKTLGNKNVSLEKRLRSNFATIIANKPWPRCYDNKTDKIHPVRYDRFPVCSSQELFQMAAEHWEVKKVELLPIKNYDLSSLNIPNTVCDKGWEEAHNPGSTSITMKYYMKENFVKQTGSTKWNLAVDEDGNQLPQSSVAWEEVDSMEKFHNTFFVLKIVRVRALPWDRSIEVIELYLIDQFWFLKNPAHNGFHRFCAQGIFCSGFVDYCLQDNGARFNAKKEHITSREIDSTFNAYCRSLGSTKGKFVTSGSYNQKKPGQSSSGSSNSQPTSSSGPAKKTGYQGIKKWSIDDWSLKNPDTQYLPYDSICKDFNFSSCTRKFENATRRCTDPTTKEVKLHVCSKKLSKFPCAQLHPIKEHPK